MPGGVVEVVLDRKPALVSEPQILSWVESAARAVAAYYGSFPVARTTLIVHGGGPGGVSSGRTVGVRGAARIVISVGDAATVNDLKTNWELVHEMVHLAFPSMDGETWIEEGLATYVEPLVRARAGLAPTDDIWKWLVWGLPKGQDALSGWGLDGARSWAATYWGGALYCFDADVAIREKTGGKKSLDDALRAIVRAGGNVTVSWSLEKALDTGDREVGSPVLRDVYARMAHQPPRDDLPAVFARLGVKVTDSGVVYDDAAPLSWVRRGITTGR
ncbi:MAG TPA: hypothetical protein VMN82_10815 [Thermoanaerobaculia bacterium]|nr:hypothetical protein [Thermoanaerobaculia bacterium]